MNARRSMHATVAAVSLCMFIAAASQNDGWAMFGSVMLVGMNVFCAAWMGIMQPMMGPS